MLRQDDMVKSQLVLVSWRYGVSYGGHLASLMIMGCIANRVRAGWGQWLNVIEKIPNYSALNETPNDNKFPEIWEPTFVRLLHEVDSVYDSSGVDYSKGAFYWCDLRTIERDWFREKILQQPENHPRVADMNSLTLFK